MSEGGTQEGEGISASRAPERADWAESANPSFEAAEPLDPVAAAAQAETEAAEKQAARRADLVTRLGTAAVLIPFVLWAIVQGGLIYLGIVIGIGFLAQREFYGLIEDKGAKPLASVGLGFGAAVMLAAYFGSEYHAMQLMTASLLVLMVAQVGKAQIHEAMASLSGTFFGVFYVAWLLSHAVLLRQFSEGAASHYDPVFLATLGVTPDIGIFLMIYCLVTIVGCDAGAYFAGRAWGKRRLASEISPNKSVEGALGGIIFGVLCGLVTKYIFDAFWPDLSVAMPYSIVLAFGLALCVVGIIGDLVESLLKRDAEVKDTGALLPGMGGVLDRIDAPLLGLPALYYLMLTYLFFQTS